MSDPFGSSEIWVCAAEMPSDGGLLVATRTAGVQRVTASERTISAVNGDWQLVRLDPTLEEIAGASAASVVALHSDGWAVALGAVQETGAGGGGTEEFTYAGNYSRQIELWAWVDGAFVLAARGVTGGASEALEIVVTSDELLVLQLAGLPSEQRVFSQRGKALVEMSRADWPVIASERMLFSNSAARLNGNWYGVAATYSNEAGATLTGATMVCEAEGAHLVQRAAAVNADGLALQGLGAAGNAGAAHLGLSHSDGGLLPKLTWYWGVYGADGSLAVTEIAGSLDSLTSGAPGVVHAVSAARFNAAQTATRTQENALCQVERRVARPGGGSGSDVSLVEVRLGCSGDMGLARPTLTALRLGCEGRQGPALLEIRLAAGAGLGTARPALDEIWLTGASDTPEAHTERPRLLTLQLGCSDDSGAERPAVLEIRLEAGAGLGTSRPTLDEISLTGEGGTAVHSRRPRLLAIVLGGQRETAVPSLAEIRAGASGYVTPPTGSIIRYVRMEGTEAAVTAKLIVEGAVEELLALVRVDSAAAQDDWSSYTALAFGENQTLPLPGYLVEVAVAKVAEADAPGMRLDVPRPPAD